LALVSGGSYRLVRAYGHGDKPKWGESLPLSSNEASQLRVRWTANGPGASRPQAGLGRELHADAHDKPSTPRSQPPAQPKPVQRTRLGRARPPRPQAPTRKERIAAAEAALLNADLRTTIDQLSRAARQAPLAYEQLNWLGLAHYMQAEYDDAERVWQQARTSAPERAEAVNNLANVAKRRGDGVAERALIDSALALDDEDCHALNGLALLQAKAGESAAATATLARSDAACGGQYAYTSIQRAALLALADDREGAFAALEAGLMQLDTLVPIKEYEVWMDLTRDPAFASLRGDARFTQLTRRYLPRASSARGG
jgi:tetratricopeptide (TPR) repeat protein